MRRYLYVALWPAGMAAIAAATAIAARRAPARRLPVAAGHLGRLASVNGTAATGGAGMAGASGWLPGAIRLGAASCASGALAYGVMALLGPTVVNRGPAIDEPILEWTDSHRVRAWAAIMERLGKVGNTWTTWGAAGTAGVCLAASWRKHKWLPPASLAAAIVVDHYTTLALRYKFRRPGPPTSPNGTYPSGGCDRVVLFYGLVADMLWREFSGNPRARVWAAGTVAALAYNEVYSRVYLSKHWFTDSASGVLYGGLLLAPFLAGIRLIAGPARVPAPGERPELAAPRAPVTRHRTR
jgi:membrane-associated phospholipid phosphatase